eukprot:CAMPEP_0201492172 /NCGR_PEP_ID=MMETSP0151_2-20130828/32119_1 /ASSEMBLY_ACC=CAM_ASM_000257 /TAXON_ID=200890 /ORGANISM="Paramoeba atlantica, Strain 621/1 / CCAP 1560/9" /LENGTH=67 /DNA_ID=CAMNT_0047878845 /DNA_START=660 /DNA_END=860 /DNA_ORIENTATION=-
MAGNGFPMDGWGGKRGSEGGRGILDPPPLESKSVERYVDDQGRIIVNTIRREEAKGGRDGDGGGGRD